MILVDARFDQAGMKAENALKNAIAVSNAGLIRRTPIEVGEIPLLDVPPLKVGHTGKAMTASEWIHRFHNAHRVLVQKAEAIAIKKGLSARQLSQILARDPKIPDMGVKTTRLAIRWLYELVPELRIDMSDSEVPVDRNLYRVAARLSLIDPNLDKYFGEGSPADMKLQQFAKETFPRNPSLIDEPMWMEARSQQDGGHCHSTVQCSGCIFERICPRMYPGVDPSGIGYVS